MYKLLIVDDEEIIRDSLSTFIKWDKLGFEVVRCLSDGRDAIAYLSNNQVDVILCDIKMTFVSGLELACYVYENNLPIVVVIISGYKQFEFAQQAIKYNVAHYLLKPTQINEVNRTFTEIKRQLDLDIENRERLNKEREQYNELIGFLQEQFFTDLLMGALRDEDEILNRLKIARLEYELVNCSCCVMKIQLHNVDAFLEGGWEYGKSGFINMVKKLLGENDRKLFYYTMDLKSDAFFVLIINRSNIEGFQTYLENRSHEINASFRTAFNIETEVKVLGFYESMFHLHHSLYDLNHVESDVKRFFRSSDTEVSDTTIERKKLLVSNIVFGNLNFIAGLFDSLFDEAVGIGAGAGERQARDFLLDLITLLRNKLHDIDIDVSNAAKEVISYQYFLALNEYTTGRRSRGAAARSIDLLRRRRRQWRTVGGSADTCGSVV